MWLFPQPTSRANGKVLQKHQRDHKAVDYIKQKKPRLLAFFILESLTTTFTSFTTRNQQVTVGFINYFSGGRRRNTTHSLLSINF